MLWTCVDRREGGQAPPLLWSVGEEGMNLEVLHG